MSLHVTFRVGTFNVLVRRGPDGEMRITREPIPAIPAELKQVIEERQPKRIAVNISSNFAFADGLSAGERDGMVAHRPVQLEGLPSQVTFSQAQCLSQASLHAESSSSSPQAARTTDADEAPPA